MACPPPGSKGDGARPTGQAAAAPRQPLHLETASREPRCAMCAGPWRDLGHCKGVCLRCGYMQSCVDTI